MKLRSTVFLNEWDFIKIQRNIRIKGKETLKPSSIFPIPSVEEGEGPYVDESSGYSFPTVKQEAAYVEYEETGAGTNSP